MLGKSLAAALFAFAVLPLSAQAAGERALAQTEADAGHYAQALPLYRAAAEAGDRIAQRTVGLMLYFGEFLYGDQVRRDVGAARRYFEMAAAQDCQVSRFMLMRLAARLRG